MKKFNLILLSALFVMPLMGEDSGDWSNSGTVAYKVDLDTEDRPEYGVSGTNDLTLVRDAVDEHLIEGNSLDFTLGIAYNDATLLTFSDSIGGAATDDYALIKDGDAMNPIDLLMTDNSTAGSDDYNGADPDVAMAFSEGQFDLNDTSGVYGHLIEFTIEITEAATIYNFDSGIWAETIYIKAEQG
jgi:hypothetical protein